MTIPASMPSKVTYRGDGVTVNFPVPFRYFENTNGTKQLKVVLADANGENEVVQVENTDFTITAAGANSGTLTMLVAPPLNYKLTIVYNMPIEQLTDYKEFGRLPSESIETAFDKITAILKQINEILGRCIQTTLSTDSTPDEVFNDFKQQMATLISTAQAAITTAGEYADEARQSAAEAFSYVDKVVFGMKREAITVNDWQLSSGKYSIFFPDEGIVAAAYKSDGNGNYEKMSNIDIESSDGGVTITTYAPFAGYVLLANTVNTQYIHTQSSAAGRWVITHNLGKYPSIQCLNDDGVVMAGTVKHDSLNSLHVDFTEDVSGIAVLN